MLTAKPNATEPLLDAAFLKKLERLSLMARRPFAGQMKGEKRSLKRGTSIEFADYREYVPGDDLRYVDWNTAARLDKMFLKIFVEEEDLFIALLLDTSKSMDFGSPTKLRYAAQLAAALGYIGLSNYDRVNLQAFGESRSRPLAVQRGRGGVLPFFAYLQGLQADGQGSIGRTLNRYAATVKTKGIAVVLSDFFDPGWQEGLRALTARGFQVVVLHVLDREEVTPTLLGDLRIIDSETSESKEMSVSPQLLARYQQSFNTFCGELETFCSRYGMDYVRMTTDAPVEQIVLQTLRRSGLLQ